LKYVSRKLLDCVPSERYDVISTRFDWRTSAVRDTVETRSRTVRHSMRYVLGGIDAYRFTMYLMRFDSSTVPGYFIEITIYALECRSALLVLVLGLVDHRIVCNLPEFNN